MNPADCLKTRPQRVVLLGLGVSRMAYTEDVCVHNVETPWDEVWAVNFGGKIYRHDKLWLMDDMREQAKALPFYGRMMAVHDKPIITTTPYPEFPMSVRFPIEEVCEALGDDFLNSTVAYAIAWAMVTGVKDLWLYGCDFHYPNQTRAEEGGQCAAYLLGLSRHFGMSFHMPNQTTLLGCYQAKEVQPMGTGTYSRSTVKRPLYGYAKQPFFPEEDPNARARYAQPIPVAVGGPQVRQGAGAGLPAGENPTGDGDHPGSREAVLGPARESVG